MGQKLPKEAADVVLADDNFETILGAIEEGRTIYSNISKFVHMMFSHNLGEVLMIFTAITLGWPLPLMPYKGASDGSGTARLFAKLDGLFPI